MLIFMLTLLRETSDEENAAYQLTTNGLMDNLHPYPEVMEKRPDLPEKHNTPQQLMNNHEEKTHMKLHPDVRLSILSIHLSIYLSI